MHLSPLDCWIDVVIPVTSPLWERDVGRAFHWIGQVWADALGDLLGPAGPAIATHRGPPSGREAGRLVCFAGLGPGEVTVGGRKVVGLSQRRWRTGVKFQCLVLPRWQPGTIGRYLDPVVLAAAGVALDSLPIGLTGLSGREPVADRVEVARAFVAHLPSPTPSTRRRAGIEPTAR